MSHRNIFSVTLVLTVLVGCGGPETRPCQSTTYLLPEDDVLRQQQYHYEDGELRGTTTRVGANGDILETTDYVYDDDGRALGQVLESEGDDGQPVTTAVSYTYDADDRLVSEEWLVDDQIDRRIEYVHDAEGRLLEERYYGEGPTPAIARAVRHHYDDNGWRTATEAENDGDGVWDWRTDYTFDEDGLPLTVESGPIAGSVSERTDLIYDREGRLIEQADDTDTDGQPDIITRYAYDDDGRMVVAEVDNDYDGSIELRRELTYDDEDRLISEVELVADESGVPTASRHVTSSRSEHDYGCWDK